ncbi:hypothetical protein BHE74_00001043 [Ensete ventricosum]|nr:hypothetical protein BHE74_00001043 [Ensete ventricosum]
MSEVRYSTEQPRSHCEREMRSRFSKKKKSTRSAVDEERKCVRADRKGSKKPARSWKYSPKKSPATRVSQASALFLVRRFTPPPPPLSLRLPSRVKKDAEKARP